MNNLSRFLPFLRWFPLSQEALKADFIAGITVVLVLIPQSMAYAQLAGMPAYYGLYAAFLPVAVAALWGSSNQLGTGPVAVVSLLTASSLAVYAAPGSKDFIALAIMLALLVGLIQLVLGAFKLGVIVNFLSHPVIVGFTNAAAIIIGLSQVSKLFGVPMGRSEHFINDIVGVFQQVGDTHLPTLAMGVLAIAIMWGLKKYRPRLPGVLIAVVVTTLLSWAIGFEHNIDKNPIESITDPDLRELVVRVETAAKTLDDLVSLKAQRQADYEAALKAEGEHSTTVVGRGYGAEMADIRKLRAEEEVADLKKRLRAIAVVRVADTQGRTQAIYPATKLPAGAESDGHSYRIHRVKDGHFLLAGGGEVVGTIPEGLPRISVPHMDMGKLVPLLSTALVISLVGFMEAISIAKAMAARTRQRLDPNQELIGQGLANIFGSLTQAFPASGSFSRSAVNINAGAQTGLSSVFTALFVLITLLFLTPLLYHLPQAVLAAVIIMAVIGLVNAKAVIHAWHAQRHDGIAALVTFVATLAFAPHLDNGIMIGAGLALILYLLRTMKPRVATLGRFHDGTLRDIKVNPGLPTSEHIMAMRFDGELYFANVAYFEDTVLEAVAEHPRIKYMLIVGDGINQLDASGEEVVHHLVKRLRSNGVELVFSGLKKQVLDVMRTTNLFEFIGQRNIFPTEDQAIMDIYERLGDEAAEDLFCPVRFGAQ
ncbi:MAG: STAS domain-containing protein [Gammaproteobacteria bacterium]|nr:STAS domain-containing protein [Gammaproteobacteria bacterium]MBU1653236.1 STAS domain-containing protein [Gammaproteobacteria bacterium]MBU1961040.1 STAS domain-containing protein [Gammaproteobacteria bacterium]